MAPETNYPLTWLNRAVPNAEREAPLPDFGYHGSAREESPSNRTFTPNHMSQPGSAEKSFLLDENPNFVLGKKGRKKAEKKAAETTVPVPPDQPTTVSINSPYVADHLVYVPQPGLEKIVEVEKVVDNIATLGIPWLQAKTAPPTKVAKMSVEAGEIKMSCEYNVHAIVENEVLVILCSDLRSDVKQGDLNFGEGTNCTCALTYGNKTNYVLPMSLKFSIGKLGFVVFVKLGEEVGEIQ